ncbi:hypothetical protein M413DRAFT_449884 [Hebeloma cylindrosporum]|uniref:Uncharacterized protein n=1 Tax=Hebeloma cylindrosporum TaxID=76867 RepID=A0A0C3BUY2_HEBCY|nr:hypothetical protein M413DRAFT_449884 [Hebeloma cylindrosporum h7]
MRGLDTTSDSSTSELEVIGVCIQLLTYGSGIVPTRKTFIGWANEVARKLKSQQVAGRIKDSNALKILGVVNYLCKVNWTL